MHHPLTLLFARLLLGANLFFHGVARLQSEEAFTHYLKGTESLFQAVALIPPGLVHLHLSILPWIESVLGLLLILGWMRKLALLTGASVLLSLVIGMCLLQKWDVVGTQMVYGLFYILLIEYTLSSHATDSDHYSIDALWKRFKTRNPRGLASKGM